MNTDSLNPITGILKFQGITLPSCETLVQRSIKSIPGIIANGLRFHRLSLGQDFQPQMLEVS